MQYFKGEESVGERSTCIVMGFVYLLISMVVLIVDENVLELGLENAYRTFNESASAFLTAQGLNSSYVVRPISNNLLIYNYLQWARFKDRFKIFLSSLVWHSWSAIYISRIESG